MDIEVCPRCTASHERGEYEPRNDGSNAIAPHDVVCSCGLTLRWSVPVFKTTQSGYVLRILRHDEQPFIKG